MNDPAPRTWRQWWLERPKWLRIGCWGLATLAILQAAVLTRMYFGLREPSDMKELRRRSSVHLVYFWQPSGSSRWLSRKDRELLYGALFGKSWSNIVTIESIRPTPADLRTIRLRCPLLRHLAINGGKIGPELLEELAQCRQLTSLDLSESNVDDAAIQSLIGLKSLVSLGLRGTLVSDDVLPAFEELPELSTVDVKLTDVTQSAIIDWKNRHQRLTTFAGGRTDESLATQTYGSIRWSDGARSPGIPSGINYSWDWERENREPFRQTSAAGIHRGQLIWDSFLLGDGVHMLRLRIGGYDAEPVTIVRENGNTSTPWVEFRMPCTQEETLWRWQQ